MQRKPSAGMDAKTGNSQEAGQVPWQLKLLSKSLKKRQKLALLQKQIDSLPGVKRLLITHGDNNGALNHHLREGGGEWTWMEMERDAVPGMQEFLQEPVLPASPDALPSPDATFDIVVSLDVQEHLSNPELFLKEVARIIKPGGHVVATTPNGDPWKPVSILRRAIGMTKDKYGHLVYGYNVLQHEAMLHGVGLVPVGSGSYSGFFTELVELGINFSYTTLLSMRGGTRSVGEIAPSTAEKLKAVEKHYRLYAMVYPLLLLLSKLDVFIPFGTGYAVSVIARRPDE